MNFKKKLDLLISGLNITEPIKADLFMEIGPRVLECIKTPDIFGSDTKPLD